MMNVALVLGSMHRDKLSLQVASKEQPLPAWADWLIWLGQWMRCQSVMDGRRVAVLRLPTRRLAGAFVGLGALFSAARLHNESLDWNALQALPKGTAVYWRQMAGGKSTGYSGYVDSVRDIGGSLCLAIDIESPRRSKGATFFLPRATALSYGVTLGVVSNRTDVRLSAAASLLRSIIDDASLAWIRSPSADSALVTERSTFLDDLSAISLTTGRECVVPFIDALAIGDAQGRQHGKLLLVPDRAETLEDSPSGLTILDGASAASRLGRVTARSAVILLDQAEYDEEIMHSIYPFIGHSTDVGIHLPADYVAPVPEGIEVFVFGLPSDGEKG